MLQLGLQVAHKYMDQYFLFDLVRQIILQFRDATGMFNSGRQKLCAIHL